MNNDAMTLDCTVLFHDGENYIFPTRVFAEFFLLIDKPNVVKTKKNTSDERIYSIPWKTHFLPLVELDLTPQLFFSDSAKIAIVHALFSSQSLHAPFFAFHLTAIPYRIRVSARTIEWVNNEKKTVKIIQGEKHLRGIVFDLFDFSKRLENILNQIKF